MDKIFQQAEQRNCDTLADRIETNVPGCKVTNLGNQILIMFDNKSVGTVFPLTADTVDIFIKDFQEREWDLKDVSIEKCLDVLRDVAGLTEETNSAGVAPVNTAKAFAAPGQKTNRGTEQSQREGWQRIGEEKNRDQSGRKDARDYPFGEDPIGRLDRVKRSEGRRLTETDTPQVPEDLFSYLRDMLPMQPEQITMDDAGTITLTMDSAKIEVVPQGIHFGVRTYVDGEQASETDKIPTGDLIRYLFGIVDKVQTRIALGKDDANSIDDISSDDAFSTLKEFARETGKSDDILRNKDLFDLKQGLVVRKSPFSGRRFSGDDFNSGHNPDVEISASLKGERTKDGHPVSINESRNISTPYADTLGGKKLVYLPGQGAVLVNAKDMPPKRKLNFDPEHGVVLTEETTPTNRRGMWKFWGRG